MIAEQEITDGELTCWGKSTVVEQKVVWHHQNHHGWHGACEGVASDGTKKLKVKQEDRRMSHLRRTVDETVSRSWG